MNSRDWVVIFILGVLCISYAGHITFISKHLCRHYKDYKRAIPEDHLVLAYVYIISAIGLPIVFGLLPTFTVIAMPKGDYMDVDFYAGVIALYRTVVIVLITVVLSVFIFGEKRIVKIALMGAFILDFVSLLVLSTIIDINDIEALKKFSCITIIIVIIVILLSFASSVSAISIAFFERMIADANDKEADVDDKKTL